MTTAELIAQHHDRMFELHLRGARIVATASPDPGDSGACYEVPLERLAWWLDRMGRADLTDQVAALLDRHAVVMISAENRADIEIAGVDFRNMGACA